MDEEMGEGVGWGCAARGGAGRTWLLALGWRGVEGLDAGGLGAGPEQSNRVDGKILETHGVKF